MPNLQQAINSKSTRAAVTINALIARLVPFLVRVCDHSGSSQLYVGQAIELMKAGAVSSTIGTRRGKARLAAVL
jgi:hypothetical protein